MNKVKLSLVLLVIKDSIIFIIQMIFKQIILVKVYFILFN